jgi:AraC family transcriptional regulator
MNALFVSIRDSLYAPGVVMGSHAHDDYSFSLVLTGEYEETIRGRTASHGAGALLVCPAGEPHAQRFGRAGLYKLVFSPTSETLERLAEVTRLSEAPALRSKAMSDVGRRILSELRRDDAFSTTVIAGLSHELLGLFGRAHAVRGPLPACVKSAMDIVRDSEGLMIGLEEAASAAACDPAKLSRAFRQHLGCTFGDYQRRQRIEQAATLLASGRLAICDIALTCGFSDQPHMTRLFKREIGMTPAAYRRLRQ